MGFIDSISKLFKRDKAAQIAEKGRGYTHDDPNGMVNSLGHVSGSRVRSLAFDLSMNQELISRYADYENMDDYPETSGGLDILADDSTIPDNLRGKTIWAESSDKVLRDILDDCLHRRLAIEDDIWSYIRSFAKYGDLYCEIVVTERGVVGLNPLPQPTMRRLVSPKGDLVGFVQDLSGQFNMAIADYKDISSMKSKFEEKGMIFFEPWEVVHWRMRSKYVHSINGWSFLDAARWPWKRLVMLEDTVLQYKLSRSPGRYAFYVDTGDLPPDEAMALVRKVKTQYKKRTLVNPSTGQLEFRQNPLSPEDDLFVPTRGNKDGTRIDVLSGPDWQSMEEVEYLRDKMFTAMKIPKSFYGGDAEADSGLAQKDVRFARTCMRVQREFQSGMKQVLRVHLAALNIDPDTVEWSTRMSVPSSIFELQQIEVMNAQAGLIETLSEYFPKEWLLKRALHLTQDEALSVVSGKASEVEKEANDQARIEAGILRKYPGVDPDVGGDEGGAANESRGEPGSGNLKLLESVKEARKASQRTLRRIDAMEPKISRQLRRVGNQ